MTPLQPGENMESDPSIWQHTCEHLNDPVFLAQPDGKILAVNRAAEKAARESRANMVGRSICQVIHGGRLPHAKCPLEEFLHTRQSRIMETRLPGLFGDFLLSIIPVRSRQSNAVTELCLIARELTGEEARQVEYHHTAQLAAIGELAAGVAHEINNPINGVINFAQLLLEDCTDKENCDILQRIVDEGERIASITHKLLSFARGNEEQKEPLHLSVVLKDTLSLMQHQLNMDFIEVTLACDEDLPLVTGNRHQLQQVFFNIISNSRYALNQRFADKDPDKQIAITFKEVSMDFADCICIQIRDSGTGIPQGLLDRLMDPFFTTKPPGAGTGLGLSISHGIIRDHNGMMRIDSVLHKYTAVSVYLPVSGTLEPLKNHLSIQP